MSASSGVVVTCPNRDMPGAGHRHTSFAGLRSRAPKRARCEGCGGALTTSVRVWAPVEHRPDRRYVRPSVTYPTPEAASAAATWDQVVMTFDPTD